MAKKLDTLIILDDLNDGKEPTKKQIDYFYNVIKNPSGSNKKPKILKFRIHEKEIYKNPENG